MAITIRLLATVGALAAVGLASAASAEVERKGTVRQLSPHVGGMMSPRMSPQEKTGRKDSIRFEPIQMIEDLVTRKDIVFLMRHGPTDWSHLDVKDVAPTDCANQRVQTPRGKIDMQNLGVLLADNGIAPGMIAVSEWCRNQQTVENLMIGFHVVDPAYSVKIETDPKLDLLLSLQGSADVSALRDRIAAWTGEGASGPLLIVTHYTNIEELTNFSVYEGEMLMIDPKRENRVLGYLRLRSAGPDVGHFNMANSDVTPPQVVSEEEELNCPVIPVERIDGN